LQSGFTFTTGLAPQSKLNPIQPKIASPKPVTMPKSFISNIGTKVNAQGVPQVAKPNVTVNINAQKTAATITATTISNAIDKALNARR
jgi:hypothetical protein